MQRLQIAQRGLETFLIVPLDRIWHMLVSSCYSPTRLLKLKTWYDLRELDTVVRLSVGGASDGAIVQVTCGEIYCCAIPLYSTAYYFTVSPAGCVGYRLLSYLVFMVVCRWLGATTLFNRGPLQSLQGNLPSLRLGTRTRSKDSNGICCGGKARASGGALPPAKPRIRQVPDLHLQARFRE